MKKIVLHFAVPTILTAWFSGIAAAGGFQINEVGAQAMAQAGAFAARASDPSAIYYNPAGLAFQGSSLYLGAAFIMPRVSFFGPSNFSLNTQTDMKNQTFTPINVYGAYELSDKVHFGIGVNNPFGLGTEWPANWPGQYLAQKTDLQTFFISPALALKFSDQFAVGVGFNYVTGSVKIKLASSIPFNAPPPLVNLDLNATGVGFEFGVLYTPLPDVSMGVSYRSSVNLDASGSASFSPNYANLGLPNGDASASLKLPETAFIGVAYKGIQNFEVEADYQFIGWSSYQSLAIEFKTDPTKNTVQPKNYQDTYILRLGGEYTLGDIKLRAGYLYDHSPVNSQYVDPMLPDADRNGYNVGLGYRFAERWRADVAYFFLRFNQRTVGNTVTGFDGTYNMTANLFGVNVGYIL